MVEKFVLSYNSQLYCICIYIASFRNVFNVKDGNFSLNFFFFFVFSKRIKFGKKKKMKNWIYNLTAVCKFIY